MQEDHIVQAHPTEVCFLQISFAQVGPDQIGLAQVRTPQIGSFLPDVCLSDNDPHLLACELLVLKGIHGYTTIAFRLTPSLLAEFAYVLDGARTTVSSFSSPAQ